MGTTSSFVEYCDAPSVPVDDCLTGCKENPIPLVLSSLKAILGVQHCASPSKMCLVEKKDKLDPCKIVLGNCSKRGPCSTCVFQHIKYGPEVVSGVLLRKHVFQCRECVALRVSRLLWLR